MDEETIWGFSAMTHDAGLAVIRGGRLLFAAQSERYSRVKGDMDLHPDLIAEGLTFGKPDRIAYYENPWEKKSRQFWTGDFGYAADFRKMPRRCLSRYGIDAPVACVGHHLSHASAGFLTSQFKDATVVVVDAVGEWQTSTIWYATGNGLELKYEVDFPSSIGLLYSAFTKRCGFRPNDEEYIVMGMAAYGQPVHVSDIREDFLGDLPWELRVPVHRGIGDWKPEAKVEDLAASIQSVLEDQMIRFVQLALLLTGSPRLVLCGGVALNCVANSRLAKMVEDIWIFPNPGDAGSAVGCAAHLWGSHLHWDGPYLGTVIGGPYPVERALREILDGQVVGVANGPAEFGPRALGNRSLFADPRAAAMKDRVNRIKHRQEFRPFAPVVLEEHAAEWFDMPTTRSPYMQFVAQCKRPEEVPAICHVDGTSRVQTVTAQQHTGLHELLCRFYEATACPVLLNTSLNVRGEPLVNDLQDAGKFSFAYGVSVL